MKNKVIAFYLRLSLSDGDLGNAHAAIVTHEEFEMAQMAIRSRKETAPWTYAE